MALIRPLITKLLTHLRTPELTSHFKINLTTSHLHLTSLLQKKEIFTPHRNKTNPHVHILESHTKTLQNQLTIP